MDYLYDLMRNTLAWLGLWDLEAKMVFVGLDNAGKTTLLGMLKDNRLRSTKPTFQPNQEELKLGLLTFRTFDLGGHEGARQLWRDYFIDVDAIVFLVDASNRDRFEAARAELNYILTNDRLAQVPVLILGNKVDRTNAVSEDQLKQALGVGKYTTGKGSVKLPEHQRPVEVFMCSVVNRTGYGHGFRWLAQYVKGN